MHTASNRMQKSEATFFAAGTEHISQITALAQHIWPAVYAGILTPQQIDNMLAKIYSQENLHEEMSKLGHKFTLAYWNDAPAGYASAYKEGDIIWLKKLYVAPAMQGKGLGKQLINAATKPFLPAQEIRLLVNPNNAGAHRFYTHNGFTKIGEVPVRMGDWNFNDHLFSRPVKE